MWLSLLLACGARDKAETAEEAPVALDAPGPWRVGYRESSLSYADPDGEGERALRLALWFPTEAETGAEARYMGAIDAPGVLDDPAPAEGPLPLVLFSHGHQGYAENSSFLMTHLASHGFLVAAPDHTDNTFLDGSDRATEIYYQRPLDLSAVLDHLLGGGASGLAASDDPVLLIGHSFGGYTSFVTAGAAFDLETWSARCASGTDTSAFCSTWSASAEAIFSAGLRDARVGAILPMAAGDADLFDLTSLGALTAPVLLMGGTLDEATTSSGDPCWAALRGGPDRRVTITGGGHQVFTDFSGVLDPQEGEIDADEGFRIIEHYALAWALRTIGDEAGASVLDGEELVAEAAVWEE